MVRRIIVYVDCQLDLFFYICSTFKNLLFLKSHSTQNATYMIYLDIVE